MLALRKEGKTLTMNGHLVHTGSSEMNPALWLENLE
jgi:hypothetical protein